VASSLTPPATPPSLSCATLLYFKAFELNHGASFRRLLPAHSGADLLPSNRPCRARPGRAQAVALRHRGIDLDEALMCLMRSFQPARMPVEPTGTTNGQRSSPTPSVPVSQAWGAAILHSLPQMRHPKVGHSLHMLPPLPPAQLVTIPEHSPFTHPSVPFLFCPSPFLSPPSPFLTPHEDTQCSRAAAAV
jgi:hypothetical protein